MSKYHRVNDLVKAFKRPHKKSGVYAFFDIKHFNVDELKIEETVALYKASGVTCIIPSIVDSIRPSKKAEQSSAVSRGRRLETTEITPPPPSASEGRMSASHPE